MIVHQNGINYEGVSSFTRCVLELTLNNVVRIYWLSTTVEYFVLTTSETKGGISGYLSRRLLGNSRASLARFVYDCDGG